MRRLLFLVGVILAPAAFLIGATSYTPAAHYSAHSVTSGPGRFTTPVEGFLVIDVATTTVADQTITLDSQLSGYLERIVYAHNGNDASWSLTVTDESGVALYANAAASAAADPYSVIVTEEDSVGNVYGGVPFSGALSIAIADADGGTGDSITVRLYVREAWRR